MELMDFSVLLAIPAVQKSLDLYRQLITEHNLRKALYTLGAWAVGIGITFLVTQSSVDLPVGNWADVVLLGIGVGSTASVVHDFSTRGEYEPVPLTLGAFEQDPSDFVEPDTQ